MVLRGRRMTRPNIQPGHLATIHRAFCIDIDILFMFHESTITINRI